jgi:NDP-sugar pyrophosphorylase family protein
MFKTVILAGGKGTRLKPFTNCLPKPLVPVGDQPIMEILIERLADHDLTDIIISTGYLEHLIRAYFEDGSRWGVRIDYSFEPEPLGTAGPLNLLRDRLETAPFLLVNGDTLTDLNFSDMVRNHLGHQAVITAAVTRRQVPIDLGVVDIDVDHRMCGWHEKPVHEYWAAMGAYVIEPDALSRLPDGKSDLPDLVRAWKGKVRAYIHAGEWLDIGRPEDYAKACEKKVKAEE